MTCRARSCAVVLLLLAASLAPRTAAEPAASTPDPKALARAEVTVLDAAVADLKKEYAAPLKDPQSSKLRAQSSYFVDHPVRLAPESLLDALERPLGDDPRCVAYVRWQLLSAAPEKFDPKHLKRVLAVYEKAPAPLPRFGLSPDDKNKLDALVLKSKRDDDAALSTRLEERVRQGAEANKPILAYRDELYARLPEGYESLVAGLRDARERTAAAAGGGAYDAHAARVVKDAQAWAQSGSADPDQCARLSEIVARLRFVRSEPYYARAVWRQVRPSWSTRSDGVYSPRKLADLEAVLKEAHQLGKAQQASQRKTGPATGKRN
jgi:hypothetical protein